MGIKTVAIYSEVDQFAEHVQLADEAYLVGPSPSKDSYLNISKIIEAIKATKADAVHPGYGFLSENADFAAAVIQTGAIFIGPSPQIIKDMGDKLQAKEIARNAGIPLIPGSREPINNTQAVKDFAKEHGYPILLKAAAGGGGKGMRVIYEDDEIEEALNRTKSEALSSFSDSRVFIEKFIEHPRHIEVQILGDQHGSIYHFGERDCSLQRRHQKVVEETPAPNLPSQLRESIIEQAMKIAKHMGYYSAGTVEFVLAPDNKFYFLEVNTRLQVEHPVTEMVYEVDLVELMIRIANGEKLDINQHSIQPQGHAIEVRLYAEDADNNFFPSCGKLNVYHAPPATPALRLDSGIREGDTISIYYDPMIAKIISYGVSREEALSELQQALSQFIVSGVDTNLNYLQRLLADKDVRRGIFHTNLIADKTEVLAPSYHDLSAYPFLKEALCGTALLIRLEAEPALAIDENWICAFDQKETQIKNLGAGLYMIGSTVCSLDFQWIYQKALFFIKVNNTPYYGKATYKAGVCHITLLGCEYAIFIEREALWDLQQHLSKKSNQENANQIQSPMSGILLSLQVAVGDRIQKGQIVAIIEAMKMENTLKSPTDGIITDIFATPKDSLTKGQIIAKLSI